MSQSGAISRSSPTKPPTAWPAPASQIELARSFIAKCAKSSARTLLLPDKDADGLCSGLIVHATLVHLGLAPSLISVYFPTKGLNIHTSEERARIAKYDPRYVIVTDQGSRGGPPIVDSSSEDESAKAQTLILDHHWSTEFPSGALVCSAAHSPPVATSSTLAYNVCLPLVRAESVRERLDWLCAMGTMGDLGTAFKWEPPFPDMRACLKQWTKKVLGEAVSLVNAPRRSAAYDVETAWRALSSSASPRALVTPTTSDDVRRLFEARVEIKAETDRCTRRPPTFSGDGRVALIRISSGAQIHPLMATRWSSSLKGPRLEVVMCANDGYSPGMTNFACRVARMHKVKVGEGNTDIISILKDYAARVPGLRESMGDDFARGHKEASGGIVKTEQFEKLWETMANAEKDPQGPLKKKRKISTKGDAGQKNTLEGWLKGAPE